MKVTGMEIKNPGDSASPLHSSASVGSSNGSGTVSTDEQERLRQRIRQQVETELAERFKKLSEQVGILIYDYNKIIYRRRNTFNLRHLKYKSILKK